MSNKDKIDELRKKLYDKKQIVQQEKAAQAIEEDLDRSMYTAFKNPFKKGNNFLMARIPFKLEEVDDRIILITGPGEVIELDDKTAGLSMTMDNDDRKFLFNKYKGRKR